MYEMQVSLLLDLIPSIKWKLKNIQLMTEEKRKKALINLKKVLD